MYLTLQDCQGVGELLGCILRLQGAGPPHRQAAGGGKAVGRPHRAAAPLGKAVGRPRRAAAPSPPTSACRTGGPQSRARGRLKLLPAAAAGAGAAAAADGAAQTATNAARRGTGRGTALVELCNTRRAVFPERLERVFVNESHVG